jgi:hypothetical protein
MCANVLLPLARQEAENNVVATTRIWLLTSGVAGNGIPVHAGIWVCSSGTNRGIPSVTSQ